MPDFLNDLDAIEVLKYLKRDLLANSPYDKAVNRAIDVLNSVNRWIPCSERLPEVGIPVLIYDKHHKAFFVAKLDEDYFGFSSNMWHHPADVPFWMPLPETPKEGAEK